MYSMCLQVSVNRRYTDRRRRSILISFKACRQTTVVNDVRGSAGEFVKDDLIKLDQWKSAYGYLNKGSDCISIGRG